MEHPAIQLISNNAFAIAIVAAIVGAIITGALAIIFQGDDSIVGRVRAALSKTKRQREDVLVWLRQHYTFAEPKIGKLTPDEILYQKILFYGGRNLEQRHKLTLWEAVSLNFHVKRDAIINIKALIVERAPFGFLHINVFGPQRQGKSVLMASLAQELIQTDVGVILYCNYYNNSAINAKNIIAYSRMCYKKAWKKLGPLPPLVIIVDDILDKPDIDAAAARNFVVQMRASSKRTEFSALPVVLVTSSRVEYAPSPDYPISLQISPQEEERLLQKLTSEIPVLVEGGPRSVQDLWGELGGFRYYGNHFGAFLSSIIDRSPPSPFTLSVTSLATELSAPMCANLKLVAACQLVDLAVPIHILERQVPDVKLEDLISESQGYVGSKFDEGLNLQAPHFAWVLLRSLGAADSDAIATLFRAMFLAVISDSKHQWTRTESEFLRHVVYRLAMQRYAALGPRINGPLIARSLVEEFWPSIWAHVKSNRDVPNLAAWAATMVRINLIEHAAQICDWINGVCCRPIDDIESFVKFLTALNRLPHQTYADIKAGALPYLNLEAVLERDKSALRRRNEAVHTYVRFIGNIDPSEASRVLASVESAVPFDAMTTLVKAQLLAKKKDPNALAAFTEAVSLARGEVRANPSVFVECLWQQAANTPVTAMTEASVAEDFDQVFAYLSKWRLGWRFSKAGRVLRDYVSFLCKCTDEALTDRLGRIDNNFLYICRLHTLDHEMPDQVPTLVKQVTGVLIKKDSCIYRLPAPDRFYYATQFLCYYLRQAPWDDVVASQLLRVLRLSESVADHEERITLGRDLFRDIMPKNSKLMSLVHLYQLEALVDAS